MFSWGKKKMMLHFWWEHGFADVSNNANTNSHRQTTLVECSWGKSANKVTTLLLSSAIDHQTAELFTIWGFKASHHCRWRLKPPLRGTIIAIIHELYDTVKATKVRQLAQATISANWRHWTSVSIHNEIINDKLELHSFLLGMYKTLWNCFIFGHLLISMEVIWVIWAVPNTPWDFVPSKLIDSILIFVELSRDIIIELK